MQILMLISNHRKCLKKSYWKIVRGYKTFANGTKRWEITKNFTFMFMTYFLGTFLQLFHWI